MSAAGDEDALRVRLHRWRRTRARRMETHARAFPCPPPGMGNPEGNVHAAGGFGNLRKRNGPVTEGGAGTGFLGSDEGVTWHSMPTGRSGFARNCGSPWKPEPGETGCSLKVAVVWLRGGHAQIEKAIQDTAKDTAGNQSRTSPAPWEARFGTPGA